jgi:hypothetical protein
MRRADGSSLGMQRIGWLIAQPDWLAKAAWAKNCETNACCAGEHVIIERPDQPTAPVKKKPVLPPEAIAQE